MIEAIGIKFHPHDKLHYYKRGSLDFTKGEVVVLETDLGMLPGKVFIEKVEVPETESADQVKKVTIPDLEKIRNYNEKREEVLEACKSEIRERRLEMKLVDVAFTLDGSKIVFYFTAESRIDFRELVKTLTTKFQKSIRLQQIGSRDVTAAMGGYGLCGRELCCHKFLDDFSSITTDMARSQQMAHRGSDRISGLCGRLICCLEYEAKLYDELLKSLPAVGTPVKTSHGNGKVVGLNVVKQAADVSLDDGEYMQFDVSEIKWRH
jgi:cell fate regulator YaaT (PSP1 superfamily)